MRMRLLGTLAPPVTAALIGISIGCSAPDPGSPDWDNAPSSWGTPREGQNIPTGQATVAPTSTGTTPQPGTDSGTPATDGGTPKTDAGPVKVTAFTGAPAFVGGAPAAPTSVDKHGATGNAGQDCGSCHIVGGSGPKFAFAGTIAGKKAGVEVRVVNAAGAEVCGIVKTDSVGNFWCKAAAPAGADAKAAARNATAVSGMTGNIVSASCNSGATCHGGAQGLIKGP